jgi:predicted DNA-binding transcriptional regulator AlpA
MTHSDISRQAYSVDEFCEAHRISRATFYNLRSQKMGPRIMKVGRRTLISEEAARKWRNEMENPD